MELVVLALVVAVAYLLFRRQPAPAAVGAGRARPRSTELTALRRVLDEDVTRFGEELQRLDVEVATAGLDEAGRQDYQRALDSYEAAKEAAAAVVEPADGTHVTRTLEDGRYAVACVRARVAGEPLPARRPPCFFNPAHGPSTHDVSWAPPGGQPRDVPVCAADADRLSQGAEPDVRTVSQGVRRVPYWQGGPAYSPYARGYFGSYAANGMLSGFLVGALVSGALSDPGWSGDSFGAGSAGGAEGAADGGADNPGDTGGAEDTAPGDAAGDDPTWGHGYGGPSQADQDAAWEQGGHDWDAGHDGGWDAGGFDGGFDF